MWSHDGSGGVRPKDDRQDPSAFSTTPATSVVCHQLRADLPTATYCPGQVSISAELGGVVGPLWPRSARAWASSTSTSYGKVGDEDVAEMIGASSNSSPRVLRARCLTVGSRLCYDASLVVAGHRHFLGWSQGPQCGSSTACRWQPAAAPAPPVPAVWQDRRCRSSYVDLQRSRHGVQLRGASRAKSSGRGALRDRWWARGREYACWASCGADPAFRVAIGMPVQAAYIDFPDWSLCGSLTGRFVGAVLPELKLYGTRRSSSQRRWLPGTSGMCISDETKAVAQGVERHFRQHPHRHRAGNATSPTGRARRR